MTANDPLTGERDRSMIEGYKRPVHRLTKPVGKSKNCEPDCQKTKAVNSPLAGRGDCKGPVDSLANETDH